MWKCWETPQQSFGFVISSLASSKTKIPIVMLDAWHRSKVIHFPTGCTVRWVRTLGCHSPVKQFAARKPLRANNLYFKLEKCVYFFHVQHKFGFWYEAQLQRPPDYWNRGFQWPRRSVTFLCRCWIIHACRGFTIDWPLILLPICLKFRNYARLGKKIVKVEGCCTEMMNEWIKEN